MLAAPLPVSPPRTLLDRVPGQEDRVQVRTIDRLDRLLAQQPDELQPVVIVPRLARVDQLADLDPPVAQPPAPPVAIPDPEDEAGRVMLQPGVEQGRAELPDVVNLGRGCTISNSSGAIPPSSGASMPQA